MKWKTYDFSKIAMWRKKNTLFVEMDRELGISKINCHLQFDRWKSMIGFGNKYVGVDQGYNKL